MCHYCGYSRPADEHCPVCGGRYLRYQGIGTQKLEEELHELFPDARVLRMDADTTMSKMRTVKSSEHLQMAHMILW